MVQEQVKNFTTEFSQMARQIYQGNLKEFEAEVKIDDYDDQKRFETID